MSSVAERLGTSWPVSGISRFFGWLARPAAVAKRLTILDPAFLPKHRLRDIGLLDGRGPSLRRPERG